jgi:hypothetical protein
MANRTSGEAIAASSDMRFRALERNGTNAAKLDAFEAFLTGPGTLDRESLIVRCRFRGGAVDMRVVVDREKSRRRLHDQFEPFLRRIAPHIGVPAEVFVLVSDTIYVAGASTARFAELLGTVPFLRCDALEDETGRGALLIPDFRMLDAAYARDHAAVTMAAERTPFAARKPVMAWRGRLSGPVNPDLETCADFPRYHLLMQALRHPAIVDARLTNYTNLAATESGAALRERLDRLLGGPVPELRHDAFAAFRYVIAVDGVTAPWKTVPMHLATGSVLLMQHRWKQYFHAGLEPWTHYVPLGDEMAELAERHAWLERQPDRALAIATAGQHFAQDLLSPEAIDAFFIAIIERCGKLPRA